MEEDRRAFIILTCKPRRKRLLGRPRCGWDDNIRAYLKEIGGISTSNWSNSAQDKDSRTLVNMTLNLRVPNAMELVSNYYYSNYY